MHSPNGIQVELSAQVERVKRRTRPWKGIIALVLAITAAIISHAARHNSDRIIQTTPLTYTLVAAGTAALFCLFASIATIELAAKTRELFEPKLGTSHAAITRYAILIVGFFTTLVLTLELFGVPIEQLVLGGALTSVFVGIAAQQALSNVFAGLVLLLAHPFRVGDAIRMRAGALSGEIDGTVSEIGITYVRLSTSSGVISIPNSQVLNAVVGPLPAGDYPPPAPPAAPQVWPAPQPPPPAPEASPAPGTQDGSSAGPVGTTDGSGGSHRPGTGGEQ